MKKVLVVNPFGIGDVLFSMELVEALKAAGPRTIVGFMGNERTIELIRMNRHIDVAHEFNRDELRACLKKNLAAYFLRANAYLREIRAQRYDTMLDLSLGREFSFAGLLAGIPRRIGFDHKKRGFFLTHKTAFKSYEGKHVVDWQLSLLRSVGLKPAVVSSRLPLQISAKARQDAADLLKASSAGAHGPILVVAPGGGKSWGENAIYKQWSPERFAAAAEGWLNGRGAGVVLLGDAGERELLSAVQARLRISAVLVSGQPLEIVCAILERAALVLCNDGGILHLANALGTKTASIYGPVDENVYGPYGNDTPHVVLTEPVACRPCYKDFRFPPCAHHRCCQDELSVEKVLAGMKKIS
jgi:ADP-heptose:LPS heptosyltransferase